MNGLVIASCMVIMIALMMLIERWIFPRLGIKNNKSSRIVMCFIVIAGAIAMEEWIMQ